VRRLMSLPYKWLVAIAFVSGLFMDIMDSTVVNVALPTLGRQFHVGDTTLEWVVTGYLLSLAVWIPASGWVGDRFGTKRVFLFALAMFSLGSALCGLSWSIGSLIFFRVLQGVGGGMMTPVGTAMLFRAFPPEERAAASAVLVVPTAVAPAVGPIFGGWLVDYASWHWIFFVNVPVGICGFIFALLVLREHKESTVGRFDIAGFLLAGAGLPLILYALSQGPGAGWGSAKVLGPGIGGIALLAALVVVELRVREPMLALRLFSDRMFRTANMSFFAVIAGMMGVVFLLPLFLQQLLGLSAFQSGLTTFPQALGIVAIAQVASRIYPRVGPRRMVVAGLFGSTIVIALFMLVGLHTSQWWIRGIMFMLGVSMGFAMIPVQAATYATITPADTGRATALFSTNQRVAASIGVAVLATVLVDRTKSYVTAAMQHVTVAIQPGMGPAAIQAARTKAVQLAQAHAGLHGFHDAFLAAAALTLLGIAAAFLIHDEDAAPSMRRMTAPAEPMVATAAAEASREPALVDD